MTNQPAPSDTPITDGLSNVACDRPEGEGWYHSFAIMLEGCRQLERELTRLSAERDEVSVWNAEVHKDMASRNAALALKVIETENTLAERDRQLVEMTDAWNNALTLGRALGDKLADSQRQKAELEGKVAELTDAVEYYSGAPWAGVPGVRWCDYNFAQRADDALAFLRQSTQTEEKK